MALLLVKLVLTPALVLGTAAVGRRFGPAVSGWVVALPLDQRLPLPLLPLAAAGIGSLVLGLRLLPQPGATTGEPAQLPRWDLPVRAVVATGILLAFTGLAESLGARLAGLVAVYPMYSAVLAGFAQRHEGADAALRVLRGLLLGLFAFAGFYLVLAALLPRTTIPVALGGATAATLALQAAALLPLHCERRRAPAPAFDPVGA